MRRVQRPEGAAFTAVLGDMFGSFCFICLLNQDVILCSDYLLFSLLTRRAIESIRFKLQLSDLGSKFFNLQSCEQVITGLNLGIPLICNVNAEQ